MPAAWTLALRPAMELIYCFFVGDEDEGDDDDDDEKRLRRRGKWIEGALLPAAAGARGRGRGVVALVVVAVGFVGFVFAAAAEQPPLHQQPAHALPQDLPRRRRLVIVDCPCLPCRSPSRRGGGWAGGRGRKQEEEVEEK